MKKPIGICFTALAGMLVFSSHAAAAPAAPAASFAPQGGFTEPPPFPPPDVMPPYGTQTGHGGTGRPTSTPRPRTSRDPGPGPGGGASIEQLISETSYDLHPGAILQPNRVIRQWWQNDKNVTQTFLILGADNEYRGDYRLTQDVALELRGNLLRPVMHLRPEDIDRMGGATIRQDGIIVFPNNQVYLPNGKVLGPEESGIVYWPGETITVGGKPVPFNDFPLNVPGGTLLYRNGALVDVNGEAIVPRTVYRKEQVKLALYGPLFRLEVLARPDQLQGGATLRMDGTILLADGGVLHPDGSYVSPSGKRMAKLP